MCDIMKTRSQKLQELDLTTFTIKEAKGVELDFYDIKVLEKMGEVVKAKRGIYQKSSFTDFENEALYSALVRFGSPSSICLLSAFFYHGLTDEIPSQTWIYVPLKKNSHDESFKVIRKSNPRWETGILDIDGLRITDIHRTVIDALSDRKHITDADSMKVAKEALKLRLTSLNDLTQMAEDLGVFNRIKFKLTLLQDEYV